MKWRLVVDGAEKTDAPVPTGSPVFSPDGTRVAYALQVEKVWQVILNGRAGRSRKKLRPFRVAGRRSPITLTDDSRHFIYAYQAGAWAVSR